MTSKPGSPATRQVLSLAICLLGQVFSAAAQQAADLVERVVLVAAVAQGVLLDPAADLVDDLGAEVRSARGAVTVFRPFRFPGPPPEPGVRVSPHPALHKRRWSAG